MGFSTGKGDVAEATRNSKTSLKEEIYNEIFNIKKGKISKKVLLSGENGTGKSSLALGLMADNLKDDEIIVYIDVDNSGLEIIQKFYKELYDNGQILVYRPNKTKTRKDGAEIKDEEKIIYAISNAAMVVKDAIDEGRNIKGVIVDGVSFILEYCEIFMRLEKNLDAAAGVSIQLWKIRNKAFREFSSPYMVLPVPVIFVSHEDFEPERDEDSEHGFSSVKQRFIDECSMRIVLAKEEEDHVVDYIATIKKNRSDLNTENRKYIFLTRNMKTGDIEENREELCDIIFPNKSGEVKGE